MEHEHSRWSDERLDDLAGRVDRGFDRVDRDLRDFRVELKAEIAELRSWMFRLTIGMSLGFISLFAAILARGA